MHTNTNATQKHTNKPTPHTQTDRHTHTCGFGVKKILKFLFSKKCMQTKGQQKYKRTEKDSRPKKQRKVLRNMA